jgi:hypothetical protein
MPGRIHGGLGVDPYGIVGLIIEKEPAVMLFIDLASQDRSVGNIHAIP